MSVSWRARFSVRTRYEIASAVAYFWSDIGIMRIRSCLSCLHLLCNF
ncbi:hypothetical protein AO9_00725 [Chlamydia psittaci Mat116]|nr:hypothetical protein AO9_00725 [Chlamydia psittaci Mat116]